MSNEAWNLPFLDEAERAELQRRYETDSLTRRSLDQLTLILASKPFRCVGEHARNFLAFVVAMKQLGKERVIKDLTIGVSVFGDKDHDPKMSSKVRETAASLREKLKRYYAGEGRPHPIRISIPLGAYVPDIRDPRLSIAIGPFEDLNPKGDQTYLCDVVAEEIAAQLAKNGLIRAEHVVSGQASSAGLDYGVRGSVASREDTLCVNVYLSDLRAGRIIFLRAFESRRDDLLKLARQAALIIKREVRAAARRKARAKRRPRHRSAQPSSASGKSLPAHSQKPARRRAEANN